MKDTHTPSFPVEKDKEAQEYVSRIVKPIFEKVAQETVKNPMSVGGRLREDNDFSMYQPHNYRLYFDFVKTSFKPPVFGKTDPSCSVVTTYEYKIKNSKEHFFKGYMNCNITVKKNQVEVLNLMDYKKWFVIKHDKNYEKQLLDIDKKKIAQSIEVLKCFMKEFGGASNLLLLNNETENKVKLEDSVDKLNLKAQWNAKLTKKVYKEPSVEFKGSVFAANYFENRSVEKIAPDIAKSIDEFREAVILVNPLVFLRENVKSINDVFKFGKYVSCLSVDDKDVFSDWVFSKFNVAV